MNEQAPKPEIDKVEMTPEQVEALSKKVTVLMTKPENTDTKAPLLLFLKNKGLNAKAYRFTLDEERLVSLYPDIVNWEAVVQKATRDHLIGQEVEVFLVTTDENASDTTVNDVREEVLQLRGLNRLAYMNKAGTLRKEFPGELLHLQHDDGDGMFEYSKNGFHCSTTPEEVVSNLKTFDLLDEAKKLAGME